MGLGVSLGSPSGLNGKMKLGEGQVIQFAVGGSTGQIGRVSVSTDFVQHAQSITEPADGYVITPYFGLGASVNAETYALTRSCWTSFLLVFVYPDRCSYGLFY